MAIAGSWRAKTVTPAQYAGATRWGTGVNPIHGYRDTEHDPTITKLPLGSVEDGGFVPEDILGPEAWGYAAEDALISAGAEDYRYLEADHPNWGEGSTGRADRSEAIFAPGAQPQPEGWPSWGPHWDDNAVDGFPLAGPPGGGGVRAYSDGAEIENDRAIAVPTPGVSGGWANKAHGAVNDARTSDPAQYEINTSMNQLRRALDNDRATARDTDAARASIANRLTGMKAKSYGMSSGMGGGPGTPDMAPVTQDLPYRPWFFRQGASPPPEDHTWSELSQFTPVNRAVPADPGETVTAAESDGQDPGNGFGYSDGDFYG